MRSDLEEVWGDIVQHLRDPGMALIMVIFTISGKPKPMEK